MVPLPPVKNGEPMARRMTLYPAVRLTVVLVLAQPPPVAGKASVCQPPLS